MENNNIGEPKLDKEEWIETMRYLREASGKLYANQLSDFLQQQRQKNLGGQAGDKSAVEDIVSLLNTCPFCISTCNYVKRDDSGAICTIPSARQYYDKLIHEHSNQSQDKYWYNKYLYTNKIEDSSYTNYDMNSAELFAKPVLKRQNDKLVIDFSKLEKGTCDIAIKDFDLYQYVSKVISRRKKAFDRYVSPKKNLLKIALFVADRVIFLGNTNLCFPEGGHQMPKFINGMSFNGCTFQKKLYIQNLHFDFAYQDCSSAQINFRNSRFFDTVEFRDCTMRGENYSAEISFEDARFCLPNSDCGGSLKFYNVEFGHTRINLFQAIFGDYIMPGNMNIHGSESELCFQNSSFGEKSRIICDSMQMRKGRIELKNIPRLPEVSMCLEPIPYGYSKKNLQNWMNDNKEQSGGKGDVGASAQVTLKLETVKIYNPFVLSNVEEVFFDNVTNYSSIIGASNWGKIVKFSDENPDKATDIKFPDKLTSRLLQATICYGKKELGQMERKDKNLFHIKLTEMYNMLKVNFQQQGKYDEEDEAFIQYMKHRPYQLASRKDNGKHPVKLGFISSGFALLKWMGLYGLSPRRILLSMVIWMGFFTFIFGIMGAEAFGDGVVLASWKICDIVGQDFGGAIIYSFLCMIPFPSPLKAKTFGASLVSVSESFIGIFLFGYLSFAVVKKTLRN